MSLVNDIEAVCGDKVQHETRRSAQKHADGLRRKDRREVRVYECGYCGKWHVGHSRAYSRPKRRK